MRPWCVIAVALGLASEAWGQGMVVLRDPRRPQDLSPEPGCALWVGRLTGNDPTGEAQLRLCPRGALEVHGEFQWSSLQSGWDRRALEGAWDASHTVLTLHDTRMLESHPADGWTLCTADRYELRPSQPGTLSGGFWSEACQDNGTLVLSFVREVPDPSAPPRPRLDLHRPPDPAGHHRRRLRCDGRPAVAAPKGWALAVLGLALGGARRRRPRAP
ncbi:MAG: hypothetical protein HY909_14735 [Deltaproteobacteria bacterium]|nr:hypothetical protein [Deltaproteobacteria bacterium]